MITWYFGEILEVFSVIMGIEATKMFLKWCKCIKK